MAREIVSLVRDNDWTHMHVQCLPAHLHNTPKDIPEAVRAKIRAGRPRFDTILVLYSDCGTGGRLDRVLAEESVERIEGSHCYEAFAGAEQFHALIEAEPACFFLTDFLTRHFDRLIVRGLGLDRFPRLREKLFRRYKKVVYLAQTRDPVLAEKGRAAARFLGLDFEMRFTGLGEFQRFVSDRRTVAARPLDRAP